MDKAASLPEASFRDAVCEKLCARLGLYFPSERWSDLLRRMAAAAPELGYGGPLACLQALLDDRLGQRETEVLATHLTVGETYFFRDPEIFAALEHQLLPELIRQRRETTRRIRIWSVGCSSGEEAYSIAMTVAMLLPDLERWNISVLATDINAKALAWGREGVYGNWSFRSPLPLPSQRWFLPRSAGGRAVAPPIKSLVSFAYLNLMDEIYPSIETHTNAMDLVFCRNVLMYFHPRRVRQVLERLAGCLLDGGWLVVSPVENSLVDTPLLTPCRLPDLQLYRKGAVAPPVSFSPPMAGLPETEPDAQIRSEASTEPSAREPGAPPSPAPGLAPESGSSMVESMVRQARELADRGLLAEALACCEALIARDKLVPAWTFLHASVLLELGETGAAAAALQRCLYLDPGFVMAHFTLANLLLGGGKRQEGYRHYRNALELLSALEPGQVLAEADGMSAGRLREIIESTLVAAVGAGRAGKPAKEATA